MPTNVMKVVGVILGYFVQSFQVTLISIVAGLLVATLACLPDWPIYNRHPLKWQPNGAPNESKQTQPIAKSRKSGKRGRN